MEEEGVSCAEELCEDCTAHKTKLSVRCVKGLYHELVGVVGSKSRKRKISQSFSVTSATICICSHSGIHDTTVSEKYPTPLQTSWKDTVDVILDNNVPCIFTGYNEEEIQADAEVLRGWGAVVIEEPHANLFRYYLDARCVI